jgi:hypothetical protein
MALDARLACLEILVMAAKRAKERQATPPPTQAVVLQIEYDAYGEEPPTKGERYVLYLPAKAPSVEAWYKATARFREPPRPAPGGGAC